MTRQRWFLVGFVAAAVGLAVLAWLMLASTSHPLTLVALFGATAGCFGLVLLATGARIRSQLVLLATLFGALGLGWTLGGALFGLGGVAAAVVLGTIAALRGRRERHFEAVGKPATAKVLQARATGTVINNTSAVVRVRLAVPAVAGQPAFEVTKRIVVSFFDSVSPGDTLKVLVDPAKPRDVFVVKRRD